MASNKSVNNLRSKSSSKGKSDTNGTIANNNDDTFQSSYITGTKSEEDSEIMNGRQSRESAFSSEGLDFETSSGASSSGRSSAVQETADIQNSDAEVRTSLIRPIRNVIPEAEEIRNIVDRVRVRFLRLNAENPGDKYDQSDLDEIKRPLPALGELEQSIGFRLMSRFFNFNTTTSNSDLSDEDIDKVCKQVEDMLVARKHFNLAHITPYDFPKEFFLMNGLFQMGNDMNGLPVVYIRARFHRRWSAKLDDLFRKYVAWQINIVTKSFKDAKVGKPIDTEGRVKDGSFGICFDCYGVGYSCIDLDFMRFLVKVLVEYYPTYCQYALCIDLPWLFRSIWKLVRSWLPEEAQNTVHLITAKELPEFINEDQIPNSIKYNDMKPEDKPSKLKHQFPVDYNLIKPLEAIAKDINVSSSEVKQFRNHMDKISKEYKQLGAI